MLVSSNEPITNVHGTSINVNIYSSKVYIAAYKDYGLTMPELAIYSVNIDGSAVSKIGDFGTRATWGIGIDNLRGKLFW